MDLNESNKKVPHPPMDATMYKYLRKLIHGYIFKIIS